MPDYKPECIRFLTASSIIDIFTVLESELPCGAFVTVGSDRIDLYDPREIVRWINERAGLATMIPSASPIVSNDREERCRTSVPAVGKEEIPQVVENRRNLAQKIREGFSNAA